MFFGGSARSGCTNAIAQVSTGGFVHFADSEDEVLQLVGLAHGINVNGVSFRIKAQLKMARHIPLDRL